MGGFVSFSEQGPKVLVTILRDSGASQSVLLEVVPPLSDETSIYSRALLQGIEMNVVGVPLYCLSQLSSMPSRSLEWGQSFKYVGFPSSW